MLQKLDLEELLIKKLRLKKISSLLWNFKLMLALNTVQF